MLSEKVTIRFSEVLRKLRKKEKLNQQTLASILDINRSALTNYERGERTPSLDMLVVISDYFNVSLDYLIKGKSYDINSIECNNMLTQELMAENIALMETQLELMQQIEKKEAQINVLKEYIQAQKNYYNYLEKE